MFHFLNQTNELVLPTTSNVEDSQVILEAFLKTMKYATINGVGNGYDLTIIPHGGIGPFSLNHSHLNLLCNSFTFDNSFQISI